MIVIALLTVLSLGIGYQATKPCDDACFQRKMEEEANKNEKARPMSQNETAREMMRDR